jgi:hypothetical protein
MLRVTLLVLSLYFAITSPVFAQYSLIDKNLILKSIENAYNHSNAQAVDKKVFIKILKNKSNTNFEGLNIDILRGLTDKYVVFNEKSINGTLFIANSEGVIMFAIPNWAEEYKVAYPFFGNNYVALGRVVYNDKIANAQQSTLINYIFSLNNQKVMNVLTYTHGLNYCIDNNLLPKEVKADLDSAGISYTGCKARASVKTFTDKEVVIEFIIALNREGLTDGQYKKILEYISFPKDGKKKYRWKFERNDAGESFSLVEGEDVNPIDGSSLILNILTSGADAEVRTLTDQTSKQLNQVNESLKTLEEQVKKTQQNSLIERK